MWTNKLAELQSYLHNYKSDAVVDPGKVDSDNFESNIGCATGHNIQEIFI